MRYDLGRPDSSGNTLFSACPGTHVPAVIVGIFLVGATASLARGASPWTLTEHENLASGVAVARADAINVRVFQGATLDRAAMSAILALAPSENDRRFARGSAELSLPLPDGTLARFSVIESPIMAAALAEKFPSIKTYIVEGVDDHRLSGRVDLTPHGFHAVLRTPEGRVFIDPRNRNNDQVYASYFTRETIPQVGRTFSCGSAHLQRPAGALGQSIAMPPIAMRSSGETLRTYRLALAATGEYTAFHGGTKALAMAAMVTAVNRVNEVYEAEVSVRMVLVANNDLVIYTNAALDPYSNSDGFAMLNQNINTLNNIIGSGNYDIGHVFSTGGGGVAFLGSICQSFKGGGVTGLPTPTGDAFYIDFVAHEMGHQFGGNHTFNGISGNCAGGNRNGATAYEPGSGTTIMAYAGICSIDNVQSNSDPDFHTESLDEITTYITTGFGGTCAVQSSTGNSAPILDTVPGFTIPAATPFVLTASATDPDGDALTFEWEQRDLGPGNNLGTSDNGMSPLFRSHPSTSDPSRIFPRLEGGLGEQLPTVARTMNFRAIARDNRAGGGGVATTDTTLIVTTAVGPFRLIWPNTATTGSGFENVRWDVGGTDGAPINEAFVNILLSTDSGVTYPITLASGTPNDGNEIVEFPNTPTATARVRVEAANNIFFVASSIDFTIAPCSTVPEPQDEPAPLKQRSRYLAFEPRSGGLVRAIRVMLTDAPVPYDAFVGEARWVGPPQTFVNTAAPHTTFRSSKLQCEPYFSNWLGVATLHVHGPLIIPDSIYDIQSTACDGSIEANLSPAVIARTGKWGDVSSPFFGDVPGVQPNVVDITSIVDHIKELPSAIGKEFAQLMPAEIDPSKKANVTDIVAVVDSVKAVPYSLPGPVACTP